MRFDTLAVHAGSPSFTIGGAHPTAPPLVPASSYWYDSADDLDRVLGDQQPGYSYARYASPTVVAFEEAVAALEGAPAAVAFASGMAAIHAAVRPKSERAAQYATGMQAIAKMSESACVARSLSPNHPIQTCSSR